MWLLLGVLALLPTLGMGGFAGLQAQQSARAADQAARAAVTTADITQLYDVVFAVTNEQMPTQVQMVTVLYDVDNESASAYMGFDVGERFRSSQQESDDAFAALPARLREERPELDRLRAELATWREQALEPGVDTVEVSVGFEEVAGAVEALAEEKVASLSPGTGTVVDTRLSAAIADFGTVASAFRSAYDQGLLAGGLAFAQDPMMARELTVAVADYERVAGALEEMRDRVAWDGWEELTGSPEIEELDRVIEATVEDPRSVQEIGEQEFIDLIGAAFLRADLLTELNREVGALGVAAALEAEDGARSDHLRTVVASVVLSLAAVGFAAAVSWSISRPLRLLAGRAAMVTGGELVSPQVATGGPAEIRTVARALDEAAGGMRRIEEQALALAAGRLDDPVLSAAVPGILGESMQASVAQLSSSLREQEQLRASLAEQARHDLLTGLPNRAGFLEAAERSVARARRSGQAIGMLFVDLDGFKRANDSHGHRFGDEVLRVTAKRLSAMARGGDTVARLGGDEFVVIAEPIAGIEQAVALGERLIAAVSAPVEIDGRTARIGASVGVAVSQDGHQSASDLLAEADQAVYRAKRAGRGRVDVFNDALRDEISERNDIEDALRAAIPAGELELYYQPVVESVGSGLQGFEALVRWNRPGHGIVPPLAFIPVAEASNLVVDLGRWVLGVATSQLVAWSAHPELAEAHVSVNISGRHLLNACVVDDVRKALATSGLAAERLVIEITETMILSDLGVAVAHLQALRQLGVRIALDDFGAGYTSIGQLGRLPIDILKIDRAFVSGLQGQGDRSIVELMVGVAHTLGLGLVAEGVEDVDQLDVLQELECDDIQGYFIARPLPALDAEAWATGRTAAPGIGSSRTHA